MPPVRACPQPLSARKREVVELLQRGYLYAEIGAALGISERAVRWHVAGIAASLPPSGEVAQAWQLRKRVRDGAASLLSGAD